MPRNPAWLFAAAKGRSWCLKSATSRWLARETHWLELRTALRWWGLWGGGGGGFTWLLPMNSILMAPAW